jgi:hypothetical protein
LLKINDEGSYVKDWDFWGNLAERVGGYPFLGQGKRRNCLK